MGGLCTHGHRETVRARLERCFALGFGGDVGGGIPGKQLAQHRTCLAPGSVEVRHEAVDFGCGDQHRVAIAHPDFHLLLGLRVGLGLGVHVFLDPALSGSRTDHETVRRKDGLHVPQNLGLARAGLAYQDAREVQRTAFAQGAR
ncbi:Uncharacterised protein [Mycobacteroides abscessus subsp. abscessus]|nr:Uncharacterised protein [Mycobacteroides abscessus subsp. abscessus]